MGTVSGFLNCIKTFNISTNNVKVDLHINKKNLSIQIQSYGFTTNFLLLGRLEKKKNLRIVCAVK